MHFSLELYIIRTPLCTLCIVSLTGFAENAEVCQLLLACQTIGAWSLPKQLLGTHGAACDAWLFALFIVHASPAVDLNTRVTYPHPATMIFPSATAAWAAQLLLLPMEALERLHAFVCLQVGSAFSDPWSINNTLQVGG